MKHVSTNDTSRTAIQRSFFTVVYSNTLDFLDMQMHAFRAKLINGLEANLVNFKNPLVIIQCFPN